VDKSTVTPKTREISHRLLRLPLLIVLAVVASGTRRFRGAASVFGWLCSTTCDNTQHLPRSARSMWPDFLDDTIVPAFANIDDYRNLDAALPITVTFVVQECHMILCWHWRIQSHDPNLSPISFGEDMLASSMGRL
jgi:hypothetical protein